MSNLKHIVIVTQVPLDMQSLSLYIELFTICSVSEMFDVKDDTCLFYLSHLLLSLGAYVICGTFQFSFNFLLHPVCVFYLSCLVFELCVFVNKDGHNVLMYYNLLSLAYIINYCCVEGCSKWRSWTSAERKTWWRSQKVWFSGNLYIFIS